MKVRAATLAELRDLEGARGLFRYRHWGTRKSGTKYLKKAGWFRNGITTVGANEMLNNLFRTPTTYSWFQGLVNNSGFSAFAAADTSASHSGWTEIHSIYSNGTRPAWSPGAPSGGVITAAGTQFAFTGSGTLKGAFIISNSTKGGTTGILWATGAFDATLAVVNADTLDLTYETQLKALS